MLAQLTRKERDPTALEVEYFHNDHMGTVSFTTINAAIESMVVRSDLKATVSIQRAPQD